MILTSHTGNNADLLEVVSGIYIPDGCRLVDVTYGKGVFWKNIDLSKYDFSGTDLMDGIDFGNLPYEDDSVDVLVIDPPYMHGGSTVKESINKCYRNQNTSHESVVRLYAKGILEAARVLKKKGKILVKCQDEIESGRQRWSHIEIVNLLEAFGFLPVDMFVLTQNGKPALRDKVQKTARKNHSYLIIAEFRR